MAESEASVTVEDFGGVLHGAGEGIGEVRFPRTHRSADEASTVERISAQFFEELGLIFEGRNHLFDFGHLCVYASDVFQRYVGHRFVLFHRCLSR